jgi:hypothetical protein
MSAIDNKIKNLIIIFLSIFILLFFTKDAFYNMTELQDEKEQNTNKLNEIVNQLNDLEKLEKELKSGKKDKEIKYFMQSPNRENLIEYFHDYAEDLSNA